MPESASEHALIEGLIQALSDAPGGRVWRDPQYPAPRRPDAVLDVDIHDAHLRIVVEAKRTGYPRDIREAMWQLVHYVNQLENKDQRKIVPMVAAMALSPGARQQLRESQVGYFDLGGSLFLPAPGAYVFIDRPAPRQGRRNIDALFSPRRALALQALWAHKNEWVRVQQLAETAMVSPATASEALSELERRDWVEVRGAGPAKERRLIHPRALLDAWTEHHKRIKAPAARRFFVPASGLDLLIALVVETFDHPGLDYMVTGEAAAQVYAPYLSNVSQLTCRVHETTRAILAVDHLAAREVGEGWNLGIVFTKAEGEFAFRERGPEAWLASPLQTYLDLLHGGGRAADMAAHLREERLGA